MDPQQDSPQDRHEHDSDQLYSLPSGPRTKTILYFDGVPSFQARNCETEEPRRFSYCFENLLLIPSSHRLSRTTYLKVGKFLAFFFVVSEQSVSGSYR